MARKKMTPRRVNQAKNQGTSNDQQVPKPIMQRRASTLVGRLKQRGSRAQTELFQTSDFRRSPKKVKRAAKNSRDANNNECSPSTSGVNVKSKSSVGKYDLVSQELQESIHKVGKCGYLIRPFLDRLMKVEESDKSSIWRRTENVTKTASFIHGDFNSGEPAVDGKSFILRYSDSRVKIRRWKVGAVGMFTITANTIYLMITGEMIFDIYEDNLEIPTNIIRLMPLSFLKVKKDTKISFENAGNSNAVLFVLSFE